MLPILQQDISSAFSSSPHPKMKVKTPSCKNTGYKGRTGIFELFVVDDNLRSLILEQKSAQGSLKEAAACAGMRSLREEGLNKIYQGITTVEEVLSQTQWFV